MKKDHALRMNWTDDDEDKKPIPLTETQQAINLERIRFAKAEVDRLGEERERIERLWRERGGGFETTDHDNI